VAVASDGAFLIADTGNARVRRIAPAGNITTVAGGGSGGDGGAATDALLTTPERIAPLADGGFLIAQSQAHRIRRVLPDGTITTVAGTGTAGYSGDGGLATAAQINTPFGVAVTAEGDYLIADTFNHVVRHVDAAATPEPPGPEPLPPPVQGESANVTPVRGEVRVKFPPGASPKLHGAGGGFVPLTEAQQIPIGSTLDTSKGTVALATASGGEGDALQEGNFRGGLFVLGQSSKNPLTTLRMTGGGLNRCRGKVRKGDASAAARKRRRLFGNASGRFRTRGRNSHATVRGTVWTVTDTCKKTVTAVAEGSVRVRDLVKRRTVTVDAGERYVARSKLRKPKKRR
jgi:hypothetical protein